MAYTSHSIGEPVLRPELGGDILQDISIVVFVLVVVVFFVVVVVVVTVVDGFLENHMRLFFLIALLSSYFSSFGIAALLF